MSASNYSAKPDGTANSGLYPVVAKSGHIYYSPDDQTNDVRTGYRDPVPEAPSQNTAGWKASQLPKTGNAGTSVADSTPPISLIRKPVSQAGTEKSSKTAQSGGK